MRMKRFLSLVLAVAMLVAMTISVSAAETSKIYLTDDFPASKYANLTALKVAAGYGYMDGETYVDYTFDHDGNAETAEITLWNGSKLSSGTGYWSTTTSTSANWYRRTTPAALREAGNTYFLTYWNTGGNNITTGTNSEGAPALVMDAGSNTSNTTEMFRIFEENWTANADEAFVISFDYEPTALYRTSTFYGVVAAVNTSFIDSTGAVTAYGNKAILQTGPIALKDAETGEATGEYGLKMHPAISANYSTNYEPVATYNQVYDFTTVITASGDYMKRQSWLDGVKWGASTTNGLTTTNTVEGLRIPLETTHAWKMSDLKAYTLSLEDGAFNMTTSLGATMPMSTTSVPVKFSQPVNAVTFDKTAVTVTEGGRPLTYGTDYTVSDVEEVVAGNEIYSTANVTFLKDLVDDTEYVITVPDTVANTAGVVLSSTALTLSTPAPEIRVESFNVVKAWGTAAETTVADFTADGTLQGAALELKNNTNSDKNVAVIYAVYSTSGQLTGVVYANDTIAGDATAEIGAGMTLGAAGTVKAFVWDGMSSLKPHSGATVKTIN